MMETRRTRKVPRRQELDMRDPQQARKETVRVTRPVARTERVRMEGEWDSVLSSQRPDKVIKTPVIITRRFTEQIVALNILLQQPPHMASLALSLSTIYKG